MSPRAVLLSLMPLIACAPGVDGPVQEVEVDPFWSDLGAAPPALPAALGLPTDVAVSPLWSDLGGGRTEAGPTSALGYFAVGNGSMFGVVGIGVPANTIHNLTAPDYDKAGETFWPDVGLVLAREGTPLVPDAEAAMRLEDAAVVVTRLEAEGVALWTVDAAVWSGTWPAGHDEDVPAEHAWIVRRVLVEDVDGEGIPDDLEVQSVTGLAFTVDGDWLRRDQPGRHLWVGEHGGTTRVGTLADGVWTAPATAFSTPQHLVVTGTYDDARPATPPATDAIEATLARWRGWSDEGLQLQGPARLEALLDANRVAVRVQMAARGEPCPMIFYSRMWNRDLIGAVRFYLALGRFDDARAMLDAHWNAVLRFGDIANSYPSSSPVFDGEIPDFEAKTTPYDGRSRAEGPSYTPLAYHALWRATGEAPWASERLGLMVRTLRGQARTDGLLPFSGDETFRPVMAPSFGLPLTFLFEDETWSANSGVLWVAAAEAVADLADEVGRDDLVEAFEDDAEDVRAATEATYRRSDGALTPFVFRDDRPDPGKPYPDVGLKEAWAGYVDPLAPTHLDAVDATVDALWDEEGLFLAPPDPPVAGFGGLEVERGILTGMSAGYATWTLARTFRDELGASARYLASASDPGGTWPEVLLVDTRTGLTPFYLGSGLTEAWARYRPWEGGIDMEALLVAMAGLEVDARAGTLRVAPQLPELGPWTMRGVPIGPTTRATLAFTPGVDAHTLTVTTDGAATVVLEVDLPEGGLTRDDEAVDGEVVAERDVRRVVRDVVEAGADEVVWTWPAE